MSPSIMYKLGVCILIFTIGLHRGDKITSKKELVFSFGDQEIDQNDSHCLLIEKCIIYYLMLNTVFNSLDFIVDFLSIKFCRLRI